MVGYHIAVFKEAGAEIAAISDMNLEAAQKVAEENGIVQAFGDVNEMLNIDEIDAVSIIVPNKFHAPLAIQALNAGKHVFCEKPPALNAAEVEEMIEVCDFCDIEIFGIKFRSEWEVDAYGLVVGENNIFGRKILVHAGYGALSDYFSDIDMVIGPFTSGTAECALANIDYFCFQDHSIYSNNPNKSILF